MLPILAAILAVSACQARVVVDTNVDGDGGGTVEVAVGLDRAAVARLGDPDEAVALDDLRAAGWEVPPAQTDSDGVTWLRARRRFTTPEEAGRVMSELNPAVFRDFRLQRQDSLGRTTWTWTGTVDLSPGLAVLGDPEVASLFGGDPFGGRLTEVEQAEGRPVADMVDVSVSARLPAGERQQWHPRLGDAPLAVSAHSTETLALPVPAASEAGWWLVLAAGVVLALLAATVWRRRTRRS